MYSEIPFLPQHCEQWIIWTGKLEEHRRGE